MRGTLKLNPREIQFYWSDTTTEAMAICFLGECVIIYIHGVIKGNKVIISRILFLDSLYCHLFTCTSYFLKNETLLGIFGGQLSAQAPSPWPLILAGLFFIMLFTLLKQIINVLESSRIKLRPQSKDTLGTRLFQDALPWWFHSINYNYFENSIQKLGGEIYLLRYEFHCCI